jgi:hypothetical protein
MMEKKYSLPKMDFSFKFQSQGEETGINWVGEFRYVRPTLGDRSRIAALRTRLCGDQSTTDSEVLEFNHAIAYLRYTLKDAPAWWVDASYGLELYDGNIIVAIYNKVMEFEAEWKSRVHGGLEEDISDDADSIKESVRNAEGTTRK